MASTDSESIRPITRPHRRRRWPWILLALTLAGGIWFGRFAYLRITLRPSPRMAHWDDEVARRFPAPADAVPVSKITTVLTSRPFESDPAVTALGTTSQPFDIGDVLLRRWNEASPEGKTLQAVFAGTGFARARASLAGTLTKPWHFPLTGNPLNSWPPGFNLMASARAWAQWLAAHSHWASAHGHTDEAVDDWLLLFGLAAQLRRQPQLEMQLSAVAVEALAAQEMSMESGEHLGDVSIHLLVSRIEAARASCLSPAEVIGYQRLLELSALELVYVPEPAGWLDVSAASGLLSSVAAGPSPEPSRLWNLTSPLFHDLPTARRTVEQWFRQYEACQDEVMCRKMQEREEVNAPDRPTMLDGGLSGASFGRALELHFRGLSEVEAAWTHLGVAQYRRRHGLYPNSLKELVPQILPRLPIDYADRWPLRYRRLAKSQDDYVLYSIGSDGLDNGGMEYTTSGAEGADRVFAHKRPESNK